MLQNISCHPGRFSEALVRSCMCANFTHGLVYNHFTLMCILNVWHRLAYLYCCVGNKFIYSDVIFQKLSSSGKCKCQCEGFCIIIHVKFSLFEVSYAQAGSFYRCSTSPLCNACGTRSEKRYVATLNFFSLRWRHSKCSITSPQA